MRAGNRLPVVSSGPRSPDPRSPHLPLAVSAFVLPGYNYGSLRNVSLVDQSLVRSNLLLVAVACLGISGCPDGKNAGQGQSAALPFTGQTVEIAVPVGMGFRSTWEGPLTEWQAQTGARSQLSEYDPSEPSQVAAQFAAGTGRTLVVFPLDQLGDALATEAVAPIPETTLKDAGGSNWLDLFAGLREGLGSPRKRPSIMPLACPILVCWYRQDLLNRAGLSPPRTWDDYARLLETLDTWAPGMTAVEPWGPEFRATMFLARSVAWARHPGHFSLFFDIDSGTPLIAAPGFARGLEAAQQAWSKLALDSKDLSPADCRRRMLDGEAALAITFEPTVDEGASAGAGDKGRRPEAALLGFCPLPGSREVFNPTRKAWEPVADGGVNQVTLVGFLGLATAGTAGHKPIETEAAWHAVSHIGSRGFVSGFPPGAVGICRESQALGPIDGSFRGDEGAAWLAAVATSLRDERQVIELPVVRRSEFRAALGQALAGVMAGESSPAEGLAAADRSWRKLVEEIGPERLRNTYRAALGLNPLARKK